MNRNFEGYPDILNANQLSEILGVSRATAYQLLHMESFPTLRVGKRLLVPKAKLLLWIDRHTGGELIGA